VSPAVASSDPDVLVSVRGLAKAYRRGPERVHALEDVTFDVRPCEIVGLVGPSGSGKTTLLNVLAGWERADAGEVRWRGRRAEGSSMPWSELAIVPQDLALLEELPIGENVRLPLRLAAASEAASSEVARLVDDLGLGPVLDRMPDEASLGEQQRVAIARALALRPAFLVADEPTAHQDEASIRRVIAAFRAAAKRGTACLVATHSAELIGALDRVLSIRDGRVGPADDV
jgi:putative ABC transport system ATP-binding protein